jgi:serine/threonine-protein kinase RsbW
MMIERTKELILGSAMSEMNKLERFIEDLSDEYNINNTYFGNILVAVTEAVENAIMHGNRGQEGKRVIITFRSEEKGLIFGIEDEGEGFDYEHYLEEELEKGEDGKGIAMISRLSDKLIWLKGGRKVEFEFHIRSLDFAKSSERINLLRQYATGKEKSVKSKKEIE